MDATKAISGLQFLATIIAIIAGAGVIVAWAARSIF